MRAFYALPLAASILVNGGLGFDMWATILDRDGRVVGVVFSGTNRGDQ